MHVLLVTHSLATGGTDRVAIHLANGITKVARTTLLHAARPAEGANLIEMLDPAVERISLDQHGGSRAANLARALPGLIRAVRRLRPDLIVATGNNNSLFAYAAHRANPNPGGRFAVKITNPIVRARDKGGKRAFRRALYGMTLAGGCTVVALSEAEAAVLRELYPALAARVRVAHNPYVTDAMLAAASTRSRAGQPLSFLSIGRLHAQKNLPLMLRAWRSAGLAGARLRLAGVGPLEKDLRKLAEELGVADNVEFLGYRSDIAALLGSTDCLLLSSDYEGLPGAVLEAFAAGCPVIATDSFPAARELIGGAPGCHLVGCRDEAAFAEALRRFTCAARPDPQALCARALPYRIDAAVRSHIAALGIA